MVKKLIGLGVAITMLLALVVLSACGFDLAAYKTTAEETLQTYAENKERDNYRDDNWAEIEQLVTNGKAAVNAAADKDGVDAARKAAEEAIDLVEQKGEEGVFYSLEEAYAKGLLTVEDLQSIAFYYRGSEDENFVAKPKSPETLSQETENKIKQTYLIKKLKKDVPEATLEGIRIERYYGTYGDCIVVSVWDNYWEERDLPEWSSLPDKLIGGVLFAHYWAREIYVWTINLDY